MNTLGLDIGSHSIKLVELARDRAGGKLLTAGSILTPPKALASNIPADTEAVAIAIKKLLHDTNAKSRAVNIALPESQVFTRVIEMPALSSRELSSALQWEAEQYIPMPLDQVNMDFSVLRDAKETGTNKMEVLLVACPKALLEKYTTILELAGLTAVGAETEIIAVSRALVRSLGNLKIAMIVAMGAQTTDVAILRSGVLASTRSISAGGSALTRAIAQTFSLEQAQAEEYKKTYGLEADKLEGKLVVAVKPVMDTVINEMKRAIAFYQEKYPGETIEVMILAGGSAKIPGMITYIAQNVATGIEVQLANPWVGVTKEPRFAVLDAEGPTFAIAAGLALR